MKILLVEDDEGLLKLKNTLHSALIDLAMDGQGLTALWKRLLMTWFC